MPVCFPAQSYRDARILVLGSFPGVRSLQEQRYYAHPRNDFWKIMAQICAFDVSLSYENRLHEIKKNGIALWDVMHSCSRKGSLDSAIKPSTVKINNFGDFFMNHPDLKAIFFNGKRAEKEFKRQISQKFYNEESTIHLHGLPSTSPALATMSFAMKLSAWRVLEAYL